MLLAHGKSGLVRLSDTLKTMLDLCKTSTVNLLRAAEPYQHLYREIQHLAGDQLDGKLNLDEGESRIKKVLEGIPKDVRFNIAYLAAHEIHSLALSAVLLSCFCLESYVNTFAYFLFDEGDLLGLVRGGNNASAEILIDAVARMSIRDKWRTIGRLKDDRGFDESCPPFQDFHILFKFRDDQVHDKIVEWGSSESSKRYNGKFPDDGLVLHLSHALFAADTYWGMVQEVHRLTNVQQAGLQGFQRHYNVSPWTDESRRQELARIARKYSESFGSST